MSKGIIKSDKGTFNLGNKLGHGACYKAYAATFGSDVPCAVKIVKEFNNPQFAIEAGLFFTKNLQHQNVARIVHVGHDQLVKSSGGTKDVQYIVEELAQGGELFDYIVK